MVQMLRTHDIPPPINADRNRDVSRRYIGNKIDFVVSFLLSLFRHLTDPYSTSDLIILTHSLYRQLLPKNEGKVGRDYKKWKKG